MCYEGKLFVTPEITDIWMRDGMLDSCREWRSVVVITNFELFEVLRAPFICVYVVHGGEGMVLNKFRVLEVQRND